MEQTGYEIVEPEVLGDWIGLVKNREFLVALLSWLVEGLRKELEQKFPDIEIVVIKVTYLGAYPAIGVRHPDAQSLNLGEQVNAAATDLMRRHTALDLAHFLFGTSTRWADVEAALFSK